MQPPARDPQAETDTPHVQQAAATPAAAQDGPVPVRVVVRGAGAVPAKSAQGTRAAAAEARVPQPAPAAPEAAASAAETQLKELTRRYAALQKQCTAREGDLRTANKRLATLMDRSERQKARLAAADADLAALKAQVAQLKGAVAARDKDLAATRAQASAREAELARRGEEVATLKERAGALTATVAARDEALAQLRASYQQLYDEHATLVRQLEEGTDRYTQRKEEVLAQQVRDALATWSTHCQQLEPAPSGQAQMALVSEVGDGLRASLVDTTNAFQRDLASLRTAMESLEATRSALRKDLDLWQQGLFVARYERLARCLQSIDVELWRAREARLACAATEEPGADAALAGWDELIDHVQILSEYLRSACACFGLSFFWPQAGDALDGLRHQVLGGAAPDGTVPRVAACVAPGIEAQAAEGEAALLRPAVVTLQEENEA